MVYFNDGNIMLSQAEIDKLIQQMEKAKEEKE
jgi:flagellar motor switch protein FliM